MKRDYRLFVEDILDSIEKIEEFVADMNFDEFVNDDKTSSAVMRKLEIIGEATKNLPGYIRRKYKGLPWREMARMRDKITHGYFGINYRIVWNVIKERLPEIKPTILQILGDMKKEA
jgi:uncharacterized protein with HEPN domain